MNVLLQLTLYMCSVILGLIVMITFGSIIAIISHGIENVIQRLFSQNKLETQIGKSTK